MKYRLFALLAGATALATIVGGFSGWIYQSSGEAEITKSSGHHSRQY